MIMVDIFLYLPSYAFSEEMQLNKLTKLNTKSSWVIENKGEKVTLALCLYVKEPRECILYCVRTRTELFHHLSSISNISCGLGLGMQHVSLIVHKL